MRWITIVPALAGAALAATSCEVVPGFGSGIVSVEYVVASQGRFSSSDIYDMSVVGSVPKTDGVYAVQFDGFTQYATVDIPVRYSDRALKAKLKDDADLFQLVEATLAHPDVADLQVDVTAARLAFKGKLKKDAPSGAGKITFKGTVTSGPAQGKRIKGKIVLNKKFLSFS